MCLVGHIDSTWVNVCSYFPSLVKNLKHCNYFVEDSETLTTECFNHCSQFPLPRLPPVTCPPTSREDARIIWIGWFRWLHRITNHNPDQKGINKQVKLFGSSSSEVDCCYLPPSFSGAGVQGEPQQNWNLFRMVRELGACCCRHPARWEELFCEKSGEETTEANDAWWVISVNQRDKYKDKSILVSCVKSDASGQ